MSTDDLLGFDLAPEYELLRQKVVALPSAAGPDARTLIWAAPGGAVGVARDDSGRLEVFIAGAPLPAANSVVREALSHDEWTTGGGAVLHASRLLLPAAPHFDQVAAFICAELLNNGIADHRDAAFARTEPIIALALQRARVGNQFLVGLAGELLFLRAMIAQAPQSAAAIVGAWKGSGHTSRDFQVGPVGVESKTTAASVAKHHIQGLHQIELGISVDDQPESGLYLMSIGMTWLDSGVTYGDSLATLVEHISAAISDDAVRGSFIEALESYGQAAGGSTAAQNVQESAHFMRRFSTTFERLYDMTDPLISLPSTEDLEVYENLDVDSLSFRITLPEQVNGDLNPTVGLPDAARRVLTEAGFLPS
ncbi:PD-(D/E)XK motif protein [Demequina soli]|uniref:PD-(D/E)XK motif protein n=1 Tax=Demequina soli TaxID=1638987 RepID=UPI000782E411|nr:PD-(D/E)XK motif protein [Demequina soli]